MAEPAISRHVIAVDFEAIAEITNHYIAATAIHFGLQPVSAAELRAGWEKSASTHPYLVLLDGAGSVLGYAKSGTWRDRAAYNHTAEVGIYLRPDLHGRGHGRRLYERLITACRDRGFRTLVGGVALPNEPSQRLHAACGFSLVGIFREVGRKFDRWHDVAWYQLML
ncbi:MAG: N-acetyltransferase [Phycisphaerales bacterium]|nr:N-acetyltransferase [Phycisphaerales bacterium]